MNISKKQAMQLADFLLELLCANGIRNRGGRYTKVWPPEKLQRQLAERIREFEFPEEPATDIVESLIQNIEGDKESA